MAIKRLTQLGLFAIVVFAAALSWAEAELRIWTSVRGDQIQARFVNTDGNYVFFRKPDGECLKVAYMGLVSADREYIYNNYHIKSWDELLCKDVIDRIKVANAKRNAGDADGWREDLQVLDGFVRDNYNSLRILSMYSGSDLRQRFLARRASELIVKSYRTNIKLFPDTDVCEIPNDGGTQKPNDGGKQMLDVAQDDEQAALAREQQLFTKQQEEQARLRRQQEEEEQRNEVQARLRRQQAEIETAASRNQNPLAAWNSPMQRNNPLAPHNSLIDKENPLKPWNQITGDNNDLNAKERKAYGLPDTTYPKNKDPFGAWNDPMKRNDPFAPHNDMIDKKDPFKPWNQPFGKNDDLNAKERKAYGLPEKNRGW